ncbi:class I SAM-dependent methyltransferase [Paenibacillus lutrae]|uniref:Methyltransferase domain-containing protein n=1 Tax=Paenibacillus lutrae TaxID=2078573 RepID=A0A7X3FFH7_9BACL|nr:class I SAM-dependent methyltransferase [Paenibacillus lutrae]MVO98768.1 methyltransferase domain-containing protein [Paenibacillus lutrae]
MSERRFNPEHLHKLDNPERRAALPPEKLLAMLHIEQAKTVLDIGAGGGYFTIPAARMTSGTVYALDVEPKMLDVIRHKAKTESGAELEGGTINNLSYLEGQVEKIPMDNASVERVIASMVLHEAATLDQGLSEVARVMTPGASCFILEWEKKESPQGPPLAHRISSSEMKQAAEKHGLRVRDLSFPTDAHYIMICEK